ncbi:unnamed protein product [Amoebophrya sp. A25]|nr:unnamed protein product [Amoebophrya sp. A25]|eukprot:GSA25T00016451001.1
MTSTSSTSGRASFGSKKAKKEAEEKQCREVFDLFDKGGTGYILKSELGLVLRSLGFQLSDAQLKKIEQKFTGTTTIAGKPVQGDEGLDFAQLLEAKNLPEVKSTTLDKRTDAIHEAFQVFDPRGTGEVDLGELKHVLTSIGEKMSPEEFAEVLKIAKAEHLQHINYTDFVKQACS